MSEVIINLSTVTTNGQVTIPAEVRRLLGVKPGNKVLFFQRANGDVVIGNATVAAIKGAQAALVGVAEKAGWASDEDVLEAVMEQRYGAHA